MRFVNLVEIAGTLRPVAPKPGMICTLLALLRSVIIDGNSRLSSFKFFGDKTGKEEAASLKSRLNQYF